MKINKEILKKVNAKKAKIKREDDKRVKLIRYVLSCIEVKICPVCGSDLERPYHILRCINCTYTY